METTCAWCGAVIYRRPGQIAACKNNFCDKQCTARWQAQHPRRYIHTCIVCGTEYTKQDDDEYRRRSKFCCKECYEKFFATVTETKIELTCPVCKKEFRIGKRRYVLNAGNVICCSKKCYSVKRIVLISQQGKKAET